MQYWQELAMFIIAAAAIAVLYHIALFIMFMIKHRNDDLDNHDEYEW